MALQELNVYGLWAGTQTAKGTPNAAPAHRLIHVAGDVKFNRADGSENYSDLDPNFTDATDWIDSIGGGGTPGCEATPDELAFMNYWFHGGEIASAITGPPVKVRHETVPLPGLGHYGTLVQRRGASVVDRFQHNDTLISQLQIEGSTGNKVVRMTPTVVVLDPSEIRATDPVKAMPTKAPFRYTDGTSTFEIDGTVFRGASQFTLVMNLDLSVVYSDDVRGFIAVIGNPVVTIGVTLYLDANARAHYLTQVYGTPTPAAGAKPIAELPGLGSYGFDLTPKDAAGAVTGDSFDLDMAGVKWAVPEYPDVNADGGAAEISLAGTMRKVAGQPAYTLGVNCDAAAFTA